MIIILVIQSMHGATVKIIIIFLIYDNELFCARCMYKYDIFYILAVIVP